MVADGAAFVWVDGGAERGQGRVRGIDRSHDGRTIAGTGAHLDALDQTTYRSKDGTDVPMFLVKRKGGMWYATRGAGALGLVGGVVAAIASRGGAGPTAAPLPGAPDPP